MYELPNATFEHGWPGHALAPAQRIPGVRSSGELNEAAELMTTERPLDRLRIRRRDFQQCARGPVRLPAALLPIA